MGECRPPAMFRKGAAGRRQGRKGVEMTVIKKEEDVYKRQEIYDIVLTFVTLLELLSQQRVCVCQRNIYGEMEISRKEAVVLG